MDAVTEQVLANAPQPASQASSEPDEFTPDAQERSVVEELDGFTAKGMTIQVAIHEREDGVFEAYAYRGKRTSLVKSAYGATRKEAARRAIRKNVARLV